MSFRRNAGSTSYQDHCREHCQHHTPTCYPRTSIARLPCVPAPLRHHQCTGASSCQAVFRTVAGKPSTAASSSRCTAADTLSGPVPMQPTFYAPLSRCLTPAPTGRTTDQHRSGRLGMLPAFSPADVLQTPCSPPAISMLQG